MYMSRSKRRGLAEKVDYREEDWSISQYFTGRTKSICTTEGQTVKGKMVNLSNVGSQQYNRTEAYSKANPIFCKVVIIMIFVQFTEYLIYGIELFGLLPNMFQDFIYYEFTIESFTKKQKKRIYD
ncbi:unnamed protein product [Eruca vesicaria subsp. sativa]|uniref:Uncharacterized protein n=1 Tax=Eruca vesicaria subsp. sativa TaxID=29727 RepID=A0ABC8KGQ7_ERUVS|nr:unnamed protein product [Eruca vesicaria subsp. sativa]